jgi:hypothetical protein
MLKVAAALFVFLGGFAVVVLEIIGALSSQEFRRLVLHLDQPDRRHPRRAGAV